jgi:hypothetical protein
MRRLIYIIVHHPGVLRGSRARRLSVEPRARDDAVAQGLRTPGFRHLDPVVFCGALGDWRRKVNTAGW